MLGLTVCSHVWVDLLADPPWPCVWDPSAAAYWMKRQSGCENFNSVDETFGADTHSGRPDPSLTSSGIEAR